MKYESIEQITKDFSLSFTDLVDLKKKLKAKLSEYHPDRNGGNFSSKEDKRKYEDLMSAYEFVSNQNAEIVSRDEITALTKAIDRLVVDRTEAKSEKILSERIDSSIKSYSSVHLFPKISTTVIASIISFIWLFPNTIGEHKILSNLINTSSVSFTVLWLVTLLTTGCVWLIIKMLERRDSAMKRTLNLESTQNMLFNEFVRYQLYDEEVIKKGYLKFKKEDLIQFICGYDLKRRVYKYDYRKPSVVDIIIGNRQIDIELIQCLSDLIIGKSVSKGLVTVDSSKSLSDIYTLKVDDESASHFRQYF